MPKHLPTILKTSEINALLLAARDAADRAKTPSKQLGAWRDFSMIQTALLSGGRLAELCDLKIPNVDLAGAVINIIEGKGSKDRNVPIGKKLMPVLREWIGERKDGWLFPGPKGKHLSKRTFQLRLETLATAAGIAKGIHPHLMRHVFACELLRTGALLTEVQELLGHANLATTAIYLHVDTTRLKPAVDRLFVR